MCWLVLIATARGTMTRVNNNGDNGYPCLVPHPIQKAFDKIPFVKI